MLAVTYGLLVGVLVYKSLNWRAIYEVLVESCEVSAVILTILALASVFAVASNALGTFEHMAAFLVRSVSSETAMLLAINVILLLAGMFIDGISIFFIFLPLFLPIIEQLETLDHVVRKLDPEDVVICDDAGIQSLAAVMGGVSSEISADTTDVYFETYSDRKSVV